MNKSESNLNPLTGLPGNNIIKHHLDKLVNDPGMFAVYLDLTDFKPYNEVYGFTAGDNVIKSFSVLLKKTITKMSGDIFLGHIGGDDFFMCTDKQKVDNLFEFIGEEFTRLRAGFYSQADLTRGFIIGWDRSGSRKEFPLMGVCGVAFSAYDEGLSTAEQTAQYATYLKEYSKIHRDNDNVFIKPHDTDILSVSLKEFITDESIDLIKKRTLIEAMGESGMVHYAKILTELLKEKLPYLLKKSIIFSLGRLRYLPAESVLLEYLSHQNPHLRTRSVEALGHIGGSKYLQQIGRMVKDHNPYVAIMAVKSLAAIGHRSGLKFLEGIDSSVSKWLKLEAVYTRCILRDESVLSETEKLISDPNPVIRKKTAVAMRTLAPKGALGILYDMLCREKVPDVRAAFYITISEILRKLPGEQIREKSRLIWKIYKTAPGNLKPYYIPALVKTGDSKVKKILEKMIDSEQYIDRCRAVNSASENIGKELLYKIRKYMKTDKSPSVRTACAKTLGAMKDAGSLEYLRRALKDENISVRKAASESVLKIICDEY